VRGGKVKWSFYSLRLPQKKCGGFWQKAAFFNFKGWRRSAETPLRHIVVFRSLNFAKDIVPVRRKKLKKRGFSGSQTA
jgi:hypothetical protein